MDNMPIQTRFCLICLIFTYGTGIFVDSGGHIETGTGDNITTLMQNKINSTTFEPVPRSTEAVTQTVKQMLYLTTTTEQSGRNNVTEGKTFTSTTKVPVTVNGNDAENVTQHPDGHAISHWTVTNLPKEVTKHETNTISTLGTSTFTPTQKSTEKSTLTQTTNSQTQTNKRNTQTSVAIKDATKEAKTNTMSTATQPTVISTSSKNSHSAPTTLRLSVTQKVAVFQTTIPSNTTDFNSTADNYNSTTDLNKLSHELPDDFQSRDSFWPIALALTVGIPTVIVLAVTITVLYRGRMAKPRSLLAMYGQDYSTL